MRKTLTSVAALAFAAAGAMSGSAGAQPSQHACGGQDIAGISSTWPFAHEDHQSFAPPPGAIALWLRLFEPGVSVRQLQLEDCS